MHSGAASHGDRLPPVRGGTVPHHHDEHRSPRDSNGSVGQRAAERVRQKCSEKAAVVRSERAERLHRHLLKGEQGSSPRVATDAEKHQVALLLNQRMVDIFQDPQARSWYKLFVHMDDDLSGKINYHELEDMIRNELRISSSRLTDDQLKAIWRALDEDQSGLISSGEFGRFMRLGEHIHTKNATWKEGLLKQREAQGVAARQEMKDLLAEADDSRKSAAKTTLSRTTMLRKAEVGRTATALSQVVQRNVMSARALRQERDERLHRHLMKGTDGTTPRVATDRECDQVAIMLNHRMCDIIQDPQARSWYKLFVHMDDDLSGKINFHELEDMVRNELKISRERLSDEALKAVWLALDEDKSGLISCGEFGHFMMRGSKVHEPSEPLHSKLLRAKKAQGVELRQEKRDMLQELEHRKSSDKAGKRSNAAEMHDVLWGLRPGDSKPAWKSPRALVY